MRFAAAILLCAIFLTPPATRGAQGASPRPAFAAISSPADRMEAKLDFMADNARSAQPDQTPTELTAAEVEAYFAAGKVKLPAGVSRLRYESRPGSLTARARVDFDQVTASRRSSNPILSLFTGVHDVEVVANAAGSGGVAQVDIQSVTLDGLRIPRMALEMFIERFVNPKYPQVGLNSQFKMAARVDTAQFGENVLALTQK